MSLVTGFGGHVLRLAYEPPTLSELFRAAVSAQAPITREVSRVAS